MLLFFLVHILLVTNWCITALKINHFVISAWVDPVVHPSEFDARYREYRQANFTVLLGNFGATTPETVILQLQACEKNNLSAIISTCGGTRNTCVTNTTISSSPALLGYQLKDEPSATEYPALKTLSDKITTLGKKNALRFINLLPNYATLQQLNATSYESYVRRFVEIVQPDVLCMDHYPYFFNMDKTSNTSTEGYHRNLKILRKYSLLYDIPFMNFFNAIPFNSHLAPTKGQIAWQAFTSLSYGATGALYFTYWSPGFPPLTRMKSEVYHPSMSVFDKEGGAFDKGGGLVSPYTLGMDSPLSTYIYGPTAQYQYAKEINTLLLNYGTYLFHCNSTEVWRPQTDVIRRELSPAPANSPIIGLNETNSEGSFLPGKFMPSGQYLIGYFDCGEKNNKAMLVMNQRHDIDLWPTILLRKGFVKKTLMEVDEVSGKVRHVRDDSPGIPGLQMVLRAGHARLLVVSRSKIKEEPKD